MDLFIHTEYTLSPAFSFCRPSPAPPVPDIPPHPAYLRSGRCTPARSFLCPESPYTLWQKTSTSPSLFLIISFPSCFSVPNLPLLSFRVFWQSAPPMHRHVLHNYLYFNGLPPLCQYDKRGDSGAGGYGKECSVHLTEDPSMCYSIADREDKEREYYAQNPAGRA